MKRHQTGDNEMRAVFPPEAPAHIAAVIKARRRRALAPAGVVQTWREHGVQGDCRRLEAKINGHRRD